jgi:hypothetical protein
MRVGGALRELQQCMQHNVIGLVSHPTLSTRSAQAMDQQGFFPRPWDDPAVPLLGALVPRWAWA